MTSRLVEENQGHLAERPPENELNWQSEHRRDKQRENDAPSMPRWSAALPTEIAVGEAYGQQVDGAAKEC